MIDKNILSYEIYLAFFDIVFGTEKVYGHSYFFIPTGFEISPSSNCEPCLYTSDMPVGGVW